MPPCDLFSGKIFNEDRQESITLEILGAVQEIERIAKVRKDAGLASVQDVALAEADLSSAEESLITVRGAKRDAARALELLLGRYPSAQVDIQGDGVVIAQGGVTHGWALFVQDGEVRFSQTANGF